MGVCLPSILSFNGAAFSRTRKLLDLAHERVVVRQLQWGRVLTNAETGERGERDVA